MIQNAECETQSIGQLDGQFMSSGNCVAATLHTFISKMTDSQKLKSGSTDSGIEYGS